MFRLPLSVRPFTGAVAAALLLAACAGPGTPLEPEIPASLSVDGERFGRMINAYRATIGCGALEWDQPVAEVAFRHSADMEGRHYFSHVAPEGSTLSDRLAARGIAYVAAGENIAVGQKNDQEVLQAWIDSASHRYVIENCAYTHMGLGRSGDYWTLVLIAPPPKSDS